MSIRKKQGSRDQRRYTRSSTKKGLVLRRPAHLGRIVAIIITAIAVIVLALVWGSYLKAKSDAYRASVSNGEWTLDEEIATPHPVSVPDLRAVAIKPEGNVGDILIAGDHDGIIMTLTSEGGTLLYESAIGATAGVAMAEDAVSLTADVARVQRRGLHVTCTFTVTCFDAPDTATQTYRRGLELALLREYAEAGMDDILLFGLPAGDDKSDRSTVAFLQELRALLAELPDPPAIGVALSLTNFATDDTDPPPTDSLADEAAGIPAGTAPLYAGNITPARMLNACDYLAMDLRDQTADGLSAVLPHIRYAYVRHSLRLLIHKNAPDAVEVALSHGFERIFEMDAPAVTEKP